MKKTGMLLLAIFSLLFVSPSFAAEVQSTVNPETTFIFNTLLFLICGFLVMFMAPGFAMLECGLVTSKSVSSIAAKNIALYSIAGIMFWMAWQRKAGLLQKKEAMYSSQRSSQVKPPILLVVRKVI